MTNTTDTSRDDTRRDEKDDAEKSPERLEHEVDQARASVGRSASALSDRLSPGELIDQALGMAREHGGEFGRNLGTQVKNNPMPLILTSVGLSWMVMSSGSNGAPRTHGNYGTSTDKDGSGIKNALGDAAAKSQDKAAALGDRVHGATADVNASAQNARDSLAQFYRDQPLIAGSLGIAIGAALGALVPPTAFEDDMLGEASDRSVDAAKSTAASKYDEVRKSVRTQ
ncbi:MAG: DUF3618 domain-containing protein [Pseudohongiellaceae bacterium]